MTLNPIVALSEQFQKLINEHGSAAILRDHLALFKDQVLMLEKENLRLINENRTYKASEEKLKSDIEHLQTENEKMRSKIKESEQPTEHRNLPDKVKVDILVALSKREQTITEHLAKIVSAGVETVRFHLHELRKSNMLINNATTDDEGTHRECWELEHEGRRLLAENNLIS